MHCPVTRPAAAVKHDLSCAVDNPFEAPRKVKDEWRACRAFVLERNGTGGVAPCMMRCCGICRRITWFMSVQSWRVSGRIRRAFIRLDIFSFRCHLKAGLAGRFGRSGLGCLSSEHSASLSRKDMFSKSIFRCAWQKYHISYRVRQWKPYHMSAVHRASSGQRRSLHFMPCCMLCSKRSAQVPVPAVEVALLIAKAWWIFDQEIHLLLTSSIVVNAIRSLNSHQVRSAVN